MNGNNNQIITKKDYQLLGIKENSTPNEISSAYEKLCLKYHPEKIKLEKLRVPNDLEIKKYHEIEKVYKKFNLEAIKYKCCGWRVDRPCPNGFYPCLWEKVENGRRDLFCSQECYNSKYEYKFQYDELVEKYQKEDKEWERKKLVEAKEHLEGMKVREIKNIKRYLEQAEVKQEDLESNNQNFEQEINNITIKNSENLQYIDNIHDISSRVEKDIQSKSKKWESNEKCDNCGKQIKYQQEGNSHIFKGGIGSIDSEGNHHTFCSQECCDKGMKGRGKWVVRKDAFAKILEWMEKEGITNIYLDPNSKKLTIEYGKNNSKTIEDNNLTSEQKEIKAFFQQVGKNSLSQQEVREEVKGKNKGSDSIGLVIGIGIIAVIAALIGVIIYKQKKKGY